MSPRLAFAVETAWLAGRSTLSLFQTGAAVEIKQDQTPVTAADRQAEEIIRRQIQARFPGEAVLGEEQGLSGEGDDRWVIDPIDGTKSFVAGVPLYATLLSYELEGQPVLGVACFPALDLVVYAEAGEGAFANGRPIRVSKKQNVAGSVLCHAGLKGMAAHGLLDGMAALSAAAMATRTWCDAYGHALVAMGQAEAMVDPVVSRWDISALLPIIHEAGGECSTAQGLPVLEDLHPDGSHQLVSSNGLVHQELLDGLAAPRRAEPELA